ncbi:MAG: (d)CMP kinase [Bacilli bacterium]|nr:(d)CMP kinase [Bacilli bacterium]
MKIDKIINKIDELLLTKDNIIIGIDGPSGAGKSSLAHFLATHFQANIISIDYFFLQDNQRTKERLNKIGYFFDIERFIKEVVNNLIKHNDFYYYIYNCHSKKLIKSDLVKINKLTIIEGVYAFNPKIINLYDLKIYVDVSKEEQLKRLKNRSIQLYDMFINDWLIKENMYFEKYHVKDSSDIIVKND